MRILESGNCEPLKGTLHAVACGLMATFALYNFAAWIQRRETHSIVNAGLYAGLTKLEYDHAQHHFTA